MFQLKTDIEFEEKSENISFSAFWQHLASIYQKDIDICYSPWQNLLPISISFWYSDVVYTSQVLEVIRIGNENWNKQCLLDTPGTVMVNKENYYREYKGHTKWLSLMSSHFANKTCNSIVCAKY